MSNFQCPHCGMINVDCGVEGYKTPREIELEQEVNKLTNPTAKVYINGEPIALFQNYVKIENKYYPTDLEECQLNMDNGNKIKCWISFKDLEKFRDR